MPNISLTRSFASGNVLLEQDLDDFLDDIETFLNTTKIDDDNIQDGGITASTKLAAASITQAKMANNSVGTAQILDDNITGAKLAAAVAGAGLAQDSNGNLDVQVDGTTIEISGDTLQVVDGFPTLKALQLTSGTTFAVPSDVSKVIVEGCGGGGGGQAGAAAGAGGKGGSSSVWLSQSLTVTPSSNVTYAIGAGGAGATSVTAAGSNGSASTFGSLTFPGGYGGAVAVGTNLKVYATGGAGGTGVGLDPGDAGQDSALYSGGTGGTTTVSGYSGGGGGAAGYYGNGGNGGTINPDTAGVAASSNTGAGGGGGAGTNAGNSHYGGAGGSGQLIVYYVSKYTATSS